MSRLIVKNLPKSVTEDSLRQLFGEKGTVTDVQLKYRPDGKFRRFAFIGYQNEEDAVMAVKSLNKSYLKTSRITVEQCSTLGEKKSKTNAPNDGESVTEKVEDKTKKKNKKEQNDESAEILSKYKDDPMFEEFLQVHAPNELEKLTKLTAKQENNDVDSGQESAGTEDPESDEDLESETQQKLANEEISDMEYMKHLMKDSEKKPRQKMEKKIKEKINLYNVKLKDLPYNIKKKDIKDFFKPLSCYSIRIPRQIHGIAFVGFKTEKLLNKALVKDRSFIKGKQISVTKYIKVEDPLKNNEQERNSPSSKAKWKNQEESLKHEEDIAESGRIFFRNLAYTTTEDDLEKLFSKYGPVTEISLPIDKTTRQMKGFGVVTFLMPEHAVKAYSELDGTILHGRMLHLLPGKTKDSTDEKLDESTDYKKKKIVQQKAQASSKHNWNSLFLGHDAVAEVVAENYGTTKQAVVVDGPEGGQGSAAVRLALGETEIVAQTRKYLERQGVVLDAFGNDKAPRSKTLILVKNLPSRTEIREIKEVFQKFGEIARIILPPSGITAIVEFLEPSEAKKAFTRLAYSKFKNVPLYLEWAPENSLTTIPDSSNSSEVQSVEKVGNSEKSTEDAIVEEDEEEPEPDTTLFVKNLNFKTTDEDLRKHFEGCGKIHYANVATKKDPNDSNNKLSMGYGFVRFKQKKSTDKALKTLQQSVLDGKSLELKRSERTTKDDVKAAKKTTKKTLQTGSKILVRNVPFQASKKEIQELFSTFGEIKALRLPKKMAAGSDSHRGFAFVDYISASDAKTAFEALSQSTHLYGRRLVLEWATTEEGVEEIRKRTASHFTEKKEEVKSKKSVFNIE